MGYQYVTTNLAQGSAPPPGAPLPFDTIVLCAQEYQPPSSAFPGVEIVHVPLDDGPPPSSQEIQRALAAGRLVHRRLRQGRRVLVTCHQGRNRSGLVSGLALIEDGYSSTRAIALIQRARANALTNVFFRETLHRRAAAAG